MTPNKSRYGKNSFRIKTLPSTEELLQEHNKNHTYTSSMFHKTSYQMSKARSGRTPFTKINSLAKTQIEKILDKKQGNYFKKESKFVMPGSFSVKHDLMKLAGSKKCLDKLLQEETRVLVTAKKWLIFDMATYKPLRGFKYKKQHDIASLTKLMTFYTTFIICEKYFLTLDNLWLMSDNNDVKIQGTKMEIQSECLMTAEDLLYAMLLSSANNAATILATNLGSLIAKKRTNDYFSCYDVLQENKYKNMKIFTQLMNSIAKQLELDQTSFQNPHGMCKNLSSCRDIATLFTECLKIPLFKKIIQTKTHNATIKSISEDGAELLRTMKFQNTNKLLWMNSGCLGGKTGCNSLGGDSLVAHYEGDIIVVVLGSSGSEQKFIDCERLVGWLCKKLKEK